VKGTNAIGVRLMSDAGEDTLLLSRSMRPEMEAAGVICASGSVLHRPEGRRKNRRSRAAHRAAALRRRGVLFERRQLRPRLAFSIGEDAVEATLGLLRQYVDPTTRGPAPVRVLTDGREVTFDYEAQVAAACGSPAGGRVRTQVRVLLFLKAGGARVQVERSLRFPGRRCSNCSRPHPIVLVTTRSNVITSTRSRTSRSIPCGSGVGIAHVRHTYALLKEEGSSS